MLTLQLKDVEELDAVLDALRKGASRHEAYARFNPNSKSTIKHSRAAVIMQRLQRRFETRN